MSRKIGQYEIKREIGQGGMGTVYLGHDPRLDREVAIKVLKPTLYMEAPDFSARFDQEAKIVASLTHNCIVPIYDYNDDGQWRYFVMPYMSGGSLRDKLDKGAIPLKKALLILYRIAAGLDKAHTNKIVHRDLKPGNILFDEDDEAYLSDFGIMKLADPTGERTVQMTQTGLALGTPHYMSPEQLDGAGDLDGRSDIYALGIILYEMLTGQKPYDHDSMARVIAMHYSFPLPNVLEANPDLPPGIADVIRTAMAKKREERYSSAKTFYNRALEAVNKPRTAVKPESPKEKLIAPPTQKTTSQPKTADRIQKTTPQYSPGSTPPMAQHLKPDEQPANIATPTIAPTRKTKLKKAIGWPIITFISTVVGFASGSVGYEISGSSDTVAFAFLGVGAAFIDWLFLRRFVNRASFWLIFKPILAVLFIGIGVFNDAAIWLTVVTTFIIGYIWLFLFPKR